ncbi:TRAP transporter small permease subunit [Pseudooceanicola sp. 216_PA32_1]|uniref:TRAP transporter small permease protein n=1 Tax=Pseudooceanicola pacificus TaxID=2676438 RepID=A0A844W2U6_9RHOB|nr:TRAP transporter small permease [Pseudooceanicola pacificus]MWB78107.1 TRAP transporter small permease subunit [Pseudooceanicola pacificus]
MRHLRFMMSRIEVVLGTLAALMLLGIMVAMCADTFMRYAFTAPIAGVQDLVGRYLMVAAYFLILSLSYTAGSQVRIDFLNVALPPRLRHLIEAVTCAATAVLFALIGWLAGSRSLVSLERAEIMPGPIPWPVWVTTAVVAFGTGLLVLRLILDAVGHAAAVLGARDAPPLPSAEGGH